MAIPETTFHNALGIDPLAATFRSEKREAFSRWFPYIEGYATDYVHAILDRFAPDARSVLDPFAGTGTTAFVVAERGGQAFYCEVNPVLQALCEAKIAVYRLTKEARVKLAARLRELAAEASFIHSLPRDRDLEHTYTASFGESVFFDEARHDEILRARTWVDQVRGEDELLAKLLEVAVMACLVPVSRLKRAGDLRYKTERENAVPVPSLPEALYGQLMMMAEDVATLDWVMKAEPKLLVGDARDLAKLPSQGFDAVITSPPYINGTNYFRNTKIELWFLRCLQSQEDLARYRRASITAGINDVTIGKASQAPHPEVEAVVRALEQQAYDVRIPRMVASYFAELTDVFAGLRAHLQPDSMVAIDLGDSIYAGLHVPADRLLTACLESLGYKLQDRIVLRERRSRHNAELLHQFLLVFRWSGEDQQLRHVSTNCWQDSWRKFQRDLPHRQKPYASRNWGHPWHSLCSFPGKMKPAIAHYLVATFVPTGGKMLDPFAGVGTIPFEAALQGKTGYGFEISPPAYIVAAAKVTGASMKDCEEVLQRLQEFIAADEPEPELWEEARTFGFNGRLVEFYEPRTLKEILSARKFFQQHPPRDPAGMLVMASLLHVLHGNRPYALSRRSHPLTPYKPTGPFVYKSLVEHVRAKVLRHLEAEVPGTFVPGDIRFQDATRWWPADIDNLDAVITSPPFFESTRFYMANWLRLWFAGWSSEDFKVKSRAFVDERQKLGFDVYEAILRQARERLKPGGVVLMHLGKSHKSDMAEAIRKIAARWFAHSDLFQEDVTHCESHGIRDKGTVVAHQYLLFY